MKYVIGIDLGTSAVKILLVNQHGRSCSRDIEILSINSRENRI